MSFGSKTAFAGTPQQTVDTLQIQTWYKQAYETLQQGQDTRLADSLVKQGLYYAKKLAYPDGITDGLFLQGCLYDYRAENDQAIESLTQALNRYLQQPNHQLYLIETYGRLGLLHNKKGASNIALNYLLKGLALAEKQQQPKERLHLLIVLAMHNNDYTKNIARALDYLKEAQGLARKLDEPKCLAHIYLQYSVSYRYKQEFDTALKYSLLAATAFENQNSPLNALRAYLIQGGIYTDQQRLPELKRLLKKIAPLANKANNWQIKGTVAFIYAQYHYLKNEYSAAVNLADTALQAFYNSGDLQNQLAVKTLLGHSYLLQGKRQKGDSLLSLLSHATDSNYADQIARYDAEMRQKYNSAQRERELNLKEKNLHLVTQQRMVLMVALFLLIACFTIYYKRYRDNQRNSLLLNHKNLEIETQNQELQKTNAQNELLLREIHHRVKNNLQLASSLLNMQLRSTSNKEAVIALGDSVSRLQSMLLVHQELYDRDNLGLVNMRDYTENLTEFLLKGYTKKEYKIQHTIYIDQINLNLSMAIPLGLILTELITNSLKYAQPDDKLLHIGIELYEKDEEHYGLYYNDNGNGLPPTLDIKNTKSMGMRLIRDLTKQLKGTLNYQYDGTTTFFIYFKKPNHHVNL